MGKCNGKMVSFHVKFVQIDRKTGEQADRRTTVKQ